MSPVMIDGRTIARTFWGKAWCDNLEVLAADDLSELFGLEMTAVEDDPAPPVPAKPARGRSTKPKPGAKKVPPKRRVAGSASHPGAAAKPGRQTKPGRPPKNIIV